MNRDPLSLVLAVGLLVSAVATAGLCYWYLQCTRMHRQAQEQVALINRNRALLQSLATETMDYSKRNPAIQSVLRDLNESVRSAPLTNAPAAGGSHD